MAKLKTEVWRDKGWERGEEIPEGNQGHTHFARKSTDPPGEFSYVLKKLKRQDDPDRRARFCAEVRSMSVLEHRGIVEIVDDNVEDFKDNVELYIVTRRVSGSDLVARTRDNTLCLDDAVNLTLRILAIVDHCHSRGVVHRDIKPCHIILRDSSLDDPVLIDFGLAYHAELQPTDAGTKLGEGRGNRFFTGPEHMAGNPDVNRSPITDVTACLGLLFFSLTKQEPGVLRDHESRKPHNRVDLAQLLAGEPSWRRDILSKTFDIGFEWEPFRRWQGAEGLAARIEQLLSEQEPTFSGLDTRLSELVAKADEDSPAKWIMLARPMGDELASLIERTTQLALEKTSTYLTIVANRSRSIGEQILTYEIAILNRHDRTQIQVRLRGFLRGGQFVVSYVELGRARLPETVLGTFPIGHMAFIDEINPVWEKQLAQWIENVLGIDQSADEAQ